MRNIVHEMLLDRAKNVRAITSNALRFLKQLNFWMSTKSGIIINDQHFIYNTQEKWAKQLGISRTTIQRISKFLKEKNIIIAISLNDKYNTLYYTINWDQLESYVNQKEAILNEKIETLVDKDVPKPDNRDHYNTTKNHKIDEETTLVNEKIETFIDNAKDNSKLENIDNRDNHNSTRNPRIVQDMLYIAQDELGNFIKYFKINPKLACFMHAAFKIKFYENIDEWKNYLKLIKTSKFLTGPKFQLTLGWLLKFKTIDRILVGDLGVDKRKITLTKKEIEDQVNEHITNVDESESCKFIRKKIVKIIGAIVYNSWFKDVKIRVDNNQIVIIAKNSFIKDTINENYISILKQQGYDVMCEVIQEPSNADKFEIKNFEIDSDESENCKRLRQKIIEIWGFTVYDAWFGKNVKMEENNGLIEIYTQNAFRKDYLNDNFRVELKVCGLDSIALYNPEKYEEINKSKEIGYVSGECLAA